MRIANEEILEAVVRLAETPYWPKFLGWLKDSAEGATKLALSPNTEMRDYDAGRAAELREVLQCIEESRDRLKKIRT